MKKKTIKIPTLKQLEKIKLDKFDKYVATSTHKDYFYGEAGEEHYKLLAHISNQLSKGSKVADLGTYKGLSALALAYNPDVKVHTYDVVRHFLYPEILNEDNIEFHLKSAEEDYEFLATFDFIFLDVDPHDGAKEQRIVDGLKDAGYKGLILCDDIILSPVMKNFWANLEYKKEDISEVGHKTGTGAIYL